MNKTNKIRLGQIIISAILLAILITMDHQMIAPLKFFGYLMVYLIISINILKEGFENIFKGEIFDENLLMIIATVGAFVLKEYHEGIMVMLLFQIGELLQSLAIQRSKRSIKHLLDLQPATVRVLEDGKVVEKGIDTVEVGSHLQIRPGERVGIDGILLSDEADFDEAAITGESMPVTHHCGDEVMSGAINLTQVIELKTTVISSETTTSKMIALVKEAQDNQSSSEVFIRKFSRYYTPTVVILAALLAILPPLLMGASFQTWLYRALIFLVISCPCALVISVPLSFFSGIGAASKLGILFKGSEYIESLTHVKNAIFDKTGTLTTGSFKVTHIYGESGYSKEDILKMAAFAEQASTHPIAQSIVQAYKQEIPKDGTAQIEELSGHGVKVSAKNHTLYVGNEKLMIQHKILVPKVSDPGTIIYLALDDHFIGYLLVQDTIKPEAVRMSQKLKNWGIHCYLVTGDRQEAAQRVKDQLGFDKMYAKMLPQDKVTVVQEKMKSEGENASTLFVGDGLNDAPVIATADIGIAMGGVGSQATIEAADVVLMDDNPEKVSTAIHLSRRIMHIVKMNIIFALGIKILFLLLAALGLVGMEWAVFADVGVTIITILNAMRLLLFKEK